MPSPVKTKTDFVRRYQMGEFGNASPTWEATEFIHCSGRDWKTKYHLRNKVAGGPTYYNLNENDLLLRCYYLAANGSNLDQFYVSEMAPTAKTLIQGEVMRWHRGLYLYYSTVRKPMRDALAAEAHEAEGVKALTLLRHYLNQRSYDWLEYLLEEYPDHVIEFSTYSECWGTIPGYNTVFWECRLY